MEQPWVLMLADLKGALKAERLDLLKVGKRGCPGVEPKVDKKAPTKVGTRVRTMAQYSV